jgi:hypothetical protein
MKVPLKEFPYQPKQMPCCKECEGKRKKDCEPNPMECKDFYIHNLDFIQQKIGT